MSTTVSHCISIVCSIRNSSCHKSSSHQMGGEGEGLEGLPLVQVWTVLLLGRMSTMGIFHFQHVLCHFQLIYFYCTSCYCCCYCCCMQQFLISEMSVHSFRLGCVGQEGLGGVGWLYNQSIYTVTSRPTLERCVNSREQEVKFKCEYVYAPCAMSVGVCVCVHVFEYHRIAYSLCLFVCLFTYFSALYFHKLRRMFNLKAICVYGI